MGVRMVSHVAHEALQRELAALPGVHCIQLDPDQPPPPGLRAEVLVTTSMHGSRVAQWMDPAIGIDWVHVFGTGVDGFDIAAVGSRELTCSRGATAVPMAEWVMAMLLACVKQLPESWCSEPPSRWRHARLHSLAGQTLALVGLGSIGQAVARRARAFDMEVRALVRRPRPEGVEGVELVADVDALVTGADHVVLAAPATAATRHLINARTLAKMKPGAHLVNVARARLIDEQALRRALDEGHLSRASLDVAEPEPLPAGHWLYHHPRVRFSPHVSWSDPAVMAEMSRRLVDNLRHWLAGRPLEHRVDKQAGY